MATRLVNRFKKSLMAGGVVVIVIIIFEAFIDTEFGIRLTIWLEEPSHLILSMPFLWFIPHLIFSLVQYFIDLLFYSSVAFLILIIINAMKSYFTSRRKPEGS